MGQRCARVDSLGQSMEADGAALTDKLLRSKPHSIDDHTPHRRRSESGSSEPTIRGVDATTMPQTPELSALIGRAARNRPRARTGGRVVSEPVGGLPPGQWARLGRKITRTCVRLV